MTVPVLPPQARHAAAPQRNQRRTLLILGLILLMSISVVSGAAYYLSEQLGDNVGRVPNVFSPLDAAARPPTTNATTFLLVGTDTRSDHPTTGTNAGRDGLGSDRSDVLMLARIDPSRTAATVVSIPRDSWVDIPGHGKNKINAAYAFGGPSLLIETVENLTDIRVDHLAVVDFAGFQTMVDAVGGIDVAISEPTSLDGVQFHRGVNHLDGYAALKFVRQRHNLADGDLDRAQREQSALRSLLARAEITGMLSDIAGMYRLLDATTRSVGVDDSLTNGGLRKLALELRDIHASDVHFVRAPIAGFGRQGQQAVDYLDLRAADLWAALRNDDIGDYLEQHRADVLGATTR